MPSLWATMAIGPPIQPMVITLMEMLTPHMMAGILTPLRMFLDGHITPTLQLQLLTRRPFIQVAQAEQEVPEEQAEQEVQAEPVAQEEQEEQEALVEQEVLEAQEVLEVQEQPAKEAAQVVEVLFS